MAAALAALAWRRLRAPPPTSGLALAQVVPDPLRARGRSIATSTADFEVELKGGLGAPLLPQHAGGGARWATASMLPPEFEFDDAERVFVADVAVVPPISSEIDATGIREGDSWVLTGSGVRIDTSRTPASPFTQNSVSTHTTSSLSASRSHNVGNAGSLNARP